MIDVQQTWKKHGWVPPSQQESYTLYWEQIRLGLPRARIPEIHILATEQDDKITTSMKNIQNIFAELHKFDCRF
jgi:hypothetical protein